MAKGTETARSLERNSVRGIKEVNEQDRMPGSPNQPRCTEDWPMRCAARHGPDATASGAD
jgi:hypothetical protein